MLLKKHLNNQIGYDEDDSGILFWYNQQLGWTIIRINHKYLRCHWNDGVNKGVSYPKWQDFSGLWFIIFYSTRRQIKNISLCHFKWISSLLVPGEDIEIHMVHFPAEESLRTAAQIRNLGVGACFTSALIGCWWSSVFSALQRRILLYYFFWQLNLKCSIQFFPVGILTIFDPVQLRKCVFLVYLHSDVLGWDYASLCGHHSSLLYPGPFGVLARCGKFQVHHIE